MTSTLIILFAIASLVALVVRRTAIPYTVALVLVGVARDNSTSSPRRR
jgi:hypothetical protein